MDQGRRFQLLHMTFRLAAVRMPGDKKSRVCELRTVASQGLMLVHHKDSKPQLPWNLQRGPLVGLRPAGEAEPPTGPSNLYQDRRPVCCGIHLLGKPPWLTMTSSSSGPLTFCQNRPREPRVWNGVMLLNLSARASLRDPIVL